MGTQDRQCDTMLCGIRICVDAAFPPDVVVLKNAAHGQSHVIYNLAMPDDNMRKASDI